MPAKLKVQGADETARAFDKLQGDINDMSDTHERIARARLPGVASRTPVRTGELKASWDVEASPSAGSVTSDVSWAVPQEFGTKVMAPAAMIAKTFEAEAEQVGKDYEAAILEAAKRRGFRIG